MDYCCLPLPLVLGRGRAQVATPTPRVGGSQGVRKRGARAHLVKMATATAAKCERSAIMKVLATSAWYRDIHELLVNKP